MKNNLQIIDNVLSKDVLINLQDTMFAGDFDWHLTRPGSKDVLCDELYNVQFSHMFFLNPKMRSQYFELITPILEKLNVTILIRAKANLVMNTSTIQLHSYHIDLPTNVAVNAKTAVFYLNTNDGYTVFQDTQQKVESIENRLVIFNADQMHSGTSCTNQSYRSVINFAYI